MRDDSMPPVPDPTLVERFLAGEGSPEERARVTAWAGRSGTGAPLAELVREALREMGATTADPARYLQALRARVQPDGAPPARPLTLVPRPQGGPRTALPWRYLRRAAAAAAVGAACVAGWMMLSRDSAGSERTYRTGAGEQATFVLADGSRVQLAPNSRVTIPAGFGARSRSVTLAGDAFFTVPHALGAPFVVRAGGIDTRVLGTAFGVLADERSGAVRVAVTSGKVSAGWSRGGRSVTLVAGTIGRLDDSTAVVTTIPDLAKHVDWATGQLVFRKASIGEVLATVAGWYGVEFQIADSTLLSQPVITTIDGSDRAAALRALALLAEARLTYSTSKDGKLVVTLHPQRRARGKAAPAGAPEFTPSTSFGR